MVWFVLTTIEQYRPDSTVHTFQSDKYSKGLIDLEGSNYLMFLNLSGFLLLNLPDLFHGVWRFQLEGSQIYLQKSGAKFLQDIYL